VALLMEESEYTVADRPCFNVVKVTDTFAVERYGVK
jgi:hypothetical protein